MHLVADIGALNEGRSLNSGDTLVVLGAVGLGVCAQRRPESELRRHADRGLTFFPGNAAQRRPESELRRHPVVTVRLPVRVTALNEGRSLNSGDTRGVLGSFAGQPYRAQRRPESELRRHHSTVRVP